MSIIGAALVSGGLGLLGGLLEDDPKQQYQGQFAYPGQYKIAEGLGDYLWENIDTGLTADEKGFMRGAGKSKILTQSLGAKKVAKRQAASQGLRGGSIADIINDITAAEIPAIGSLETEIMALDVNQKRKRISDLLSFLGLKAGKPNKKIVERVFRDVNEQEEEFEDWETP